MVTFYGGSVASSFVTWDPATVTAVTLSNGNLTATNTGTTSADQGAHVATTHGKSTGKYYFEITNTLDGLGVNPGFGVGTTASTYTALGNTATTGNMCYIGTGNIYHNNVFSAKSISGLSTGDIGACALDLDNLKVWFRKGAAGLWNNTAGADPATNTGGLVVSAGTYVPFVVFGGTSGAAGGVMTGNFGDQAFTGAVPSGFTAGWSP